MTKTSAITDPATDFNLMPHGNVMHEYLVGELASLGAVIGTLTGLLPSFAALFAIVWYLILIYDRLFCRALRGVPAQILDTDRKDHE